MESADLCAQEEMLIDQVDTRAKVCLLPGEDSWEKG